MKDGVIVTGRRRLLVLSERQRPSGSLKTGAPAVYRSSVSITEEQLASDSAILQIGMIDDEGWVYVNGRLVGNVGNWQTSPSFDGRKNVHAGQT